MNRRMAGASGLAHMILHRARARPRKLRWRPMFVGGWLILNAILLTMPVTIALLAMPHDWIVWEQVPQRWEDGRLYDVDFPRYYFVFAPLAGWLFATVIVPLGYAVWWSIHLALVPLLRDWKLIALTVLSVPFWIDTMIGSTVVFALVTGIWAIRGSRLGAIAYLAVFLLMPRPLHLPLATWLLWRQPNVRVPFVILVALLTVTTVATGYTLDWFRALTWLGDNNYDNPANLSPTRLIGSAWLVVGIPLAAWLTWRGRVGLAGLALTPYGGASYLLMLLWEWPRASPR